MLSVVSEDTMIIKQALDSEKQDIGKPTGTHFAVITMMVLLVLMGIYFVVSYALELKTSPTIVEQTRPSVGQPGSKLDNGPEGHSSPST